MTDVPALDVPALLADLARHQRYRAAGDDTTDYCDHCNRTSGGYVPWPCDAARARDALRRRDAIDAQHPDMVRLARERDALAATLDKFASPGMAARVLAALDQPDVRELIRQAIVDKMRDQPEGGQT